MSSIRLFLLSAFADGGPTHGHQLRLLAEEEHVHHWTDISVGALYGAIKRLAADGLIEEVRVEREGNYPERQVYAITAAGRESLAHLRADALSTVVVRADPFDLGMTRLDRDKLDELPSVLDNRLRTLRELLDETKGHREHARPFLTVSELFMLSHKIHHLQSEIEWHEDLVANLPQIIADETARKDRQ
jgi:DNA-binding PadR family transcriptional regulator